MDIDSILFPVLFSIRVFHRADFGKISYKIEGDFVDN